MTEHLAAVAAAAVSLSGKSAPSSIASSLGSAQPNDQHRAIAQQLSEGTTRVILLGALAQQHPAFADLRLLAAGLAELTGATLGYLPEGGNAIGACIAGVLPHRSYGSQPVSSPGLNLGDMFSARLKSYIVLGAVEPLQDIAAPNALEALKAAEFVVALSPYSTAKEFAHVILPIGTFAETSGTYVNLEGRWQSVPGAVPPVGESRPAWKVLRVLGNLLNLPTFDYTSPDQVTDELRRLVGDLKATPRAATRTLQAKLSVSESSSLREIPLYQSDAIVRRAPALQATREAQKEPGV